ncbi:DUF6701 domain-containing protein [Marinobacter caseinilyticus]|uniref:DUF6701 domain-containing protein n=1 Tax=Marinobacter caseinilyticus TaxID=2692195 RepID=UPI00140A098E|nr:DUF6701 domain-containing protein [Marinobacter caseinilyticus]
MKGALKLLLIIARVFADTFPDKAVARLLALTLMTGASNAAWAVCSADYHGLATINEVNQQSQGATSRFIELKILSSGLSATDYDSWTLRACTSRRCTGDIPVSAMNDSTLPWITADDSLITRNDNLDFNAMDVRLLDAGGNLIDYLSVGGVSQQSDARCTPAFDWEVPGSNSKTLFRNPDGTGMWGFESGNSGDVSGGDTNDGGVSGPNINIDNVSVFKGESAVFTWSLSAAATRDVQVDYRTADASAVSGRDYSVTQGTSVIAAGDTSAQIIVPTLVSGAAGPRQFYLELSNAVDGGGTRFGRFETQVGVGTIIPAAVADWRFDEGGWDGSASEVLDYSESGLHGRMFNGTGFSDAAPALSGDPGTCGYGVFDGLQNQYAEISDDPRLDLSDELTISGWVYIDRFPQFGLNTIVSKDENYEFHLDANGQVYWWWRTASGATHSMTTTSAGLAVNRWHHIAVTYRSGAQRIYIDGTERGNAAFSGQLRVNNDPFQIGQDQGFAGRFFNGRIDEVSVFRSALKQAGIQRLYERRRSCPATGPAEIRVDVPTSASVCRAADVTISVRDGGGNLLSDYVGEVDLQTSSGRGNWSISSGGGTLSPDPHASNDGQAGYQFVAADGGSVVLALSNASADVLTVMATDGAAGITGSSTPVAFSDNAFVISVTDSQGSDFIAERDHALQLEAIRRDPDSGQCGLNANYNGAVDIKAWLDRSTDDPGGQAPVATAGAAKATLPDAEPGVANFAVSFIDGVAALSWVTTDVGQYRLNTKDDSSGLVVDAANNPIPVLGSGAQWTVRPDRFGVAVVDNPAAANAGGAVFVAAGDAFNLSVTALGALGGNLASYGQEGTPQGVDLTHTLVAPALGETGVLSGVTTIPGSQFAGGVAALGGVSWNEVGIIRIRASNNRYLGVSPLTTGESSNVGRFVPARFSVVVDSGSLLPYCDVGTAFGYSGSPILWSLPAQLSITAVSATEEVTRNYTVGGFLKLSAAGITRVAPTTDSGSVDGSGALFAVNSVLGGGGLSVLSPGVVSYDFSGSDAFTYAKNIDALVAPFVPALDITVTGVEDTDSVSATAIPFGISPDAPFELRYGRFALENVYGPETLAELTMPFSAEYWNGFRFVDHQADACSQWSTADISDTEIFHSLVADAGVLSGGEGGPLVLEPNATSGTDTLSWLVPLWLRDDWNGDGSLESPVATATFGVFRGHDRVIYWQER